MWIMDNGNNCVEQNNVLVGGTVFSVPLSLFIWYLMLKQPIFPLNVEKNGNVICYIALFFLYFIIYLSFCWGLQRFRIDRRMQKIKFLWGLLGAIGAISIAPLSRDLLAAPAWINALLCICITGIVSYFLITKNDISYRAYRVLIIIISCIAGGICFSPNMFADANATPLYNMHHTSAYVDSIYNVYQNMPFHGGITDQYGHYGLLLAPIVKVFGCTLNVISIIMCLLLVIVFVLYGLILEHCIKHHAISALCLVITIMSVLQEFFVGIYWQTYPHRILFPIIMLYLLVRGKKENYIWISLIGILALIWNLETGFICIGLQFVSYFIEKQKEEKWMRAFLAGVGIIIIQITSAYVFVNGYNFFANGEWLAVKQFVGMMFDSEYIEFLEEKIDFVNDITIHKIFVFFASFGWGIGKVFYARRKKNIDYEKWKQIILVSLCGIGIMTYTINRLTGPRCCTNLLFVILLGMYFKDGVQYATRKVKKRKEYYILGSYSALILIGMGMFHAGVVTTFLERNPSQIMNYQCVKEIAEEMKSDIAPDTCGMGEGTSALFAEMGMNRKYWKFDDVVKEEDIAIHDHIILLNKYFKNVPANYTCIKEYKISKDRSFGYFVRKE